MMFCSKCGKEIHDDAVVCVHCGCAVENNSAKNDGKSWLATLLLCFFLGGLGVHRFYTGYVGIGVIQLLTAGGCGVWTLVDFICILINKFKTADGKELQK